MTPQNAAAASTGDRAALAPVETIHDGMPRHDGQAEKCALGSALMSPDAAARVVEELRPSDFAINANRAVFEAIKTASDQGHEINSFTVRRELEKARGPNPRHDLYLTELIEAVPTPTWAGRYIDTLRSITPLRGMAEVGHRIADIGERADPSDCDTAVDHAQRLLDEATRIDAPTRATTVADLVTPFIESLDPKHAPDEQGVSTGWRDVDEILGGLRPGSLNVIGGRPGMGKSVAVLNMAHHVGVKLGRPVWVGTLEMSTSEYMARLVAHDAGVDGHSMRTRTLTEADWNRLARSHQRLLEAATFEISYESGMGVGHVRAALRAMRRARRSPSLVLIDYLQLMQTRGKAENRQVEVSGISRSLKALAGEFEVPIVVAAQLNRQVEMRSDRKPSPGDLRESGSIEAEADLVILLHREDAYDPETPRAGEIDFLIAKNRHGPTRTVTLAWLGKHSRIADMAWTPHRAIS